MYDDLLFTHAKRDILEACAWLEDLLRPEGDARNEAATHEDAWEQAQAFLGSVLGVLEEVGTEKIEVGGEDVPGFGWNPFLESRVINEGVMKIHAAINAQVGAILNLSDEEKVCQLLTPQLVASLREIAASLDPQVQIEKEASELMGEAD